MGRYVLLALLFIVPLFSVLSAVGSEAAPVRIGVLAKRGSEEVQKWTPTADYLHTVIPAHSFEVVPLDFPQVRQAVKDRTIDFLITNSGYYVELEHEFGVSRIATMKNLINRLPQTLFGGVIFTRSDRADINGLPDIIGKSFGAVDRESLGGWLMALREFHTQGITPDRDFKALSFAGTHDAVVLAVLKGEVDAGTVRTDTLEKMAEEGTITLASLKILNPQSAQDNFPYLHSTRLYPEWPFAKLRHTADKLAEDVAIALLRMPPTSAAARAPHIGGWTVPLDYQPVHALLQELEIGPYAYHFGKIRFLDFVTQYRVWLLIISILFVLLLVFTIGTIRLNRRLVAAEEEVSQYSLNLENLVEERTAELKKSASSLGEAQRLAHLGNWEWLIPENQVWLSDEAYRIYGFDPGKSSPTYKSFMAAVHPADRDLVNRAVDDALQKHGAYSVEHRLVLPGGIERQVHEQGEVFWDGDGKPVRMVGIVQDISEKIELEKQLRQAQKLESIGTLAGGIAHDFNNILTAILGYAHMVLDALPAESPLRASQQQVITAGQRAADLVKQILTFSRRGDQQLAPLQPQLLVNEALKLLRSTIPTTIEFKLTIDEGCGTILADPTQIHQVVMNLCTNAYHAMREKNGGVLGVTLSPVELEPEALQNKIDLQPGSYIRLEVSDTGQGMSASVLKRIFEPYFTTKGQGDGTGMGLSLVHGIVKSMGGGITVYSEVGTGTTFHVYFPRIASESRREAQSLSSLAGGNERLLVVDDEASIVQLEQHLLENLGYKVTAVTTSREAWQLFTAHPDDFDLIITDMTMPHMSGLELAGKILEVRKDMPVILCTGYSEIINEEKAKAWGICEYLMKPVNKNDLATAIRRALG